MSRINDLGWEIRVVPAGHGKVIGVVVLKGRAIFRTPRCESAEEVYRIVRETAVKAYKKLESK
jgi:hypothetical protein